MSAFPVVDLDRKFLFRRSGGPESEVSQGDKKILYNAYGSLRCSDVPLYDSDVDSNAHGLSFPSTLIFVGHSCSPSVINLSLMNKRTATENVTSLLSVVSLPFASRPESRIRPLKLSTPFDNAYDTFGDHHRWLPSVPLFIDSHRFLDNFPFDNFLLSRRPRLYSVSDADESSLWYAGWNFDSLRLSTIT